MTSRGGCLYLGGRSFWGQLTMTSLCCGHLTGQSRLRASVNIHSTEHHLQRDVCAAPTNSPSARLNPRPGAMQLTFITTFILKDNSASFNHVFPSGKAYSLFSPNWYSLLHNVCSNLLESFSISSHYRLPSNSTKACYFSANYILIYRLAPLLIGSVHQLLWPLH